MDKSKKIMSGVIIILIIISVSGLSLVSYSVFQLENEKISLKSELDILVNSLNGVNNQIINTNNIIREENESLQETRAEIIKLQSGNRYELSDPLQWETQAFISMDKTDKNEYIDPSYMCGHFARDVNNNAEAQGVRCGVVVVELEVGFHALVCFETAEGLTVMYEPQTDERVNLMPGFYYWADCVIEKSSKYYYPKSPGDEVVSWVIYW